MIRSSCSILKRAKQGGITLLLHSTHLYKNLPHILADGRIHTARELIEKHGHEHAARFLHDPHRYEQFAVGLDYINCSLTVPNAELLYHRSKSDWKADWVHLTLDLSRLNHAETLFSPVSAAAEYGKYLQNGRDGFQAMFADVVHDFTRENLPQGEPTHPQAEVLIKGPVLLKDVHAVLVPSRDVGQEVSRLCERHHISLSVEITPHLFAWPARLVKHR